MRFKLEASFLPVRKHSFNAPTIRIWLQYRFLLWCVADHKEGVYCSAFPGIYQLGQYSQYCKGCTYTTARGALAVL